MRFLPLLVLFLCGFAHAATEPVRLAVTPKQMQALGIRTLLLQSGGATAASIGLPARVDLPPDAQRVVAAPLPGLVLAVNKAVGDPVRAGETLATLSGTGLVDAQRQLALAATRARLARDNAARDQRLFDEGVIGESRLRATQAEAAMARAEDRAARASLKLYGVSGTAATRIANSGAMLDSIALGAPISGVVLDVTTTAGSRVDAGTSLFKLGRLGRLIVDIQASAAQAATMQAGQPVRIAGTAATGKILRITHALSAAQTVSVRAEISDPAHQLRPGQMVEARVGGAAARGQWRVPSAALVWHNKAPHVFVQTSGGFRLVQVVVLTQSADSASVSPVTPGALKDGERIATGGVVALKSLLSAE